MTIRSAPTAPHLRELLHDRLLRRGEPGHAEAARPWNLAARQDPALVVRAAGPDDVAAAVRLARAEGLGVGVMATGHGTTAPCDGGLLIATAGMRDARVDPVARTARVAAGARWSDVVPAAAAHGLAALPGSASGVGVVGYTLGGGFGWLGRRYGFAAGSVTAAEAVTADGELVRADADEDPDLLWGVKGGAGNLGVVTALEFGLHPVARVYGGNLYHPLDRARDLLEFYAEWSRTLPDGMATAATFRRFPPLPQVPEPLRGRAFVAVRGCWSGPDPRDGERLLAPVRAALGAPEVDTFAVLPVAGTDAISSDPVDPIAVHQHHELLRELTPGTIDALVELGTDSPLVMLEARQLGGALSRPGPDLSPIAGSDARFTLNAVGATPTPEAVRAVRAHLARLAEALRPHATGEQYLNFLDHEGATPQRVRAAYSPADLARLVALKDRYDPHNLFRFNRNTAPTGGPS